MDINIIALWLLTLVPLSISPGPANVLFAASGGAFGIRATAPFWLGTNLVCILQSLAVGLGLGAILVKFPGIEVLMKYIGVAVLLYLAFRFYRSSVSARKIIKPIGFREGVAIQLLNAKYLLIPVVMFSQFYSPQSSGLNGLLGLSFALTALTMGSNLVWIAGGSVLTSFIHKDGLNKYQGAFFGSVLLITALWLALS